MKLKLLCIEKVLKAIKFDLKLGLTKLPILRINNIVNKNKSSSLFKFIILLPQAYDTLFFNPLSTLFFIRKKSLVLFFLHICSIVHACNFLSTQNNKEKRGQWLQVTSIYPCIININLNLICEILYIMCCCNLWIRLDRCDEFKHYLNWIE